MKYQKTSPELPDEAPDWDLLMEKLADIESRLALMPQAPPSQAISDRKLAIIATSVYRTVLKIALLNCFRNMRISRTPSEQRLGEKDWTL